MAPSSKLFATALTFAPYLLLIWSGSTYAAPTPDAPAGMGNNYNGVQIAPVTGTDSVCVQSPQMDTRHWADAYNYVKGLPDGQTCGYDKSKNGGGDCQRVYSGNKSSLWLCGPQQADSIDCALLIDPAFSLGQACPGGGARVVTSSDDGSDDMIMRLYPDLG